MKRLFAWGTMGGTGIFMLILAGGVVAKSPEPVDLETERVVIFKDGYSLFSKQATGTTDEEGKVYLYDVPTAVLGTFWVVSDDGTPISLKSEMVETTTAEKVFEQCTSMVDLLRANVGEMVELELADKTVRGEVLSLLDNENKATDLEDQVVSNDNDSMSLLSSSRVTSSMPTLSSAATLVSIGDTVNPGKVYVFPVSSIKMMTQLNVDPDSNDFEKRSTFERLNLEKKKQKRLTIDFGDELAHEDVNLHIFYFTDGLQWIPTYRLDGDLEGDATLSLQGEVINDTEDIEGAVASLVVGVPHIRFRDKVSSLSLEKSFRRALQSMDGNQYQTQMFMNNAISVSTHNSGNDAMRAPLSEAMQGEQESEFFLYTIEELNLAKGARAAFPLESLQVNPRSLYRMDIQMHRDQSQGVVRTSKYSSFSSRDSTPLVVEENSVWQVLEVKNTGATPWTTGPVLVMDKGMPVSQELLTFTPSGGTVEIPLTIATRVRGLYEEHQVDRESNALSWNGRNYAKVTKEGTVMLTNSLNKPETIKVSFSTGGTVVEVSHGGQFTLNDYRSEDWGGYPYGPVNEHSDMEWVIKLVPGEKEELTYKLEYYIRD